MSTVAESQAAAFPHGNQYVRCEGVLRPGNTNCAGCGMSLGLQWLEQGLAPDKPTLVIHACCGIVTAGAFPTSAFGVPTAATTFASSPAVATGISTVYGLNHEDRVTVCWTGDGGTYDIGMATLSAAAERNESLIYVCYDNEIYGNTGGQRSSATPQGVKTSTTVSGKAERKKDIMAIMAAHRVPYAASLSLAHRDDFLRKIKTARRTKGFRFLLILSPCPTGWKSEPTDSVELIRMAVGSGLFPLFEVFDGVRYRINLRPDGTPLEDYLGRQRRYKSETIDVNGMKAQIRDNFAALEAMERAFPAAKDE
jgi:pyruvate/2-oxoacid:ferredoxin oxidoreductase beta subunit